MDLMDKDQDNAIHIPIDGKLDLHTFDPREIHDLLKEYINACLEKGIHEVKIIHGKGKGVIRRQVHAFLERHPQVEDFRLDSGPSGWGATIAALKKVPFCPKDPK